MTLSQQRGMFMDLVYLALIGLLVALLAGLAAGCARLGGTK
jgi:hypothetical protein